MKTVVLLKQLERYPLFTENDVAKVLNKSPAYVRTRLYRLHQQKYIQRIEKGKYTIHEDPLIFASYLVSPSYCSLWTALRYHNLTQQLPANILVMTTMPKKSITFQNIKIIFVQSKHFFGYKKERYADFDIFMADPEKAVIDSLIFKIPLSYLDEALDENIDEEKLADYAKRTRNKSLIKRIGYLLEQKKGSAYGLIPLDYNYIPLDYHGKKKGVNNKKWRLIINTAP